MLSINHCEALLVWHSQLLLGKQQCRACVGPTAKQGSRDRLGQIIL